MVFVRAEGTIAQQLQEERLAKLCDDNAFVNVADVLKRQRRDGAPASSVDVDVNFFEPGASSSFSPPRVHLSRCLMDQHRAYMKALDDDCCNERKAGGASADEPPYSSSSSSYSSSSSSSVSSRADGIVEMGGGRGKRSRQNKRQAGAKRKRVHGELREEDGGGGHHTIRASEDKAEIAEQVGRECRSLNGWLHSRQLVTQESTLLEPSYMAMTAPPPSHTGGYHLCSVCLLPANYKCARCCRALFCSIECHVIHDATRCMKLIV